MTPPGLEREAGAHTGGPPARPPRRLLAAALAGLVCAAAWSGCSPDSRYEVLSFFFDGVPEPEIPGAAGLADVLGPLGESALALGSLSAHSAYVERRCQECHGPGAEFGFRVTGFTALDDSVCLKCHAEVVAAPRYVHGPVATNDCLWCHQPHESPQPHLLTAEPAELCLGCHGTTIRRPPEVPEHADLERSCLACHYGHGGADPDFLREDGPGDGG